MALFVMIIRKMVQNKWLVFSLLIGILMSVALVSSMPIYSEGILSRMLKKDLERSQQSSNQYPGAVYSTMHFTEKPERFNGMFDRYDTFIKTEGAPGFQLPIQELVNDMASSSLRMKRADDPEPITDRNSQAVTVKTFSDLEKHIKLKDGKMASSSPVDGVYEVLVTERALAQFKTVLNTEFLVQSDKMAGPVKFKPVGVFEKLEDDDPYFRYGNLSDMSTSFILPYETGKQLLLHDQSIPLASAGWFLVMDYTKMEFKHVDAYLNTHDQMRQSLLRIVSLYQMKVDATAYDTIDYYLFRAANLNLLMWALNVPVLIMLAFYMFMVANLIASRQKSEIAVLRSRGAARWQVIAAYLVEGILLCGIALLIGPFLGGGLTRVLGASNGFMEFVQRVNIPIRITEESFLYGTYAAAACLIIILIPIIIATRVSIVDHKQQMARLVRTPIWHKLFLDVIALGLALYGLYSFKNRLKDLQSLGLNTTDLNIDPLQFIVPALFIMGGGLLLLRLYPWILRLVYWIGKKWWPPSIYATLIQVGRSSSQYQFLMIFLIMTIATGVFSASAARTINLNSEDRIQYGNGADVVLNVNWINDAPPPQSIGGGPGGGGDSTPIPRRVNYLEPPFEPYLNLPGVEYGAKVFTKQKAFYTFNKDSAEVTLMGIETDQFGMTTWFRDSLLDYPLNDYLNLMAAESDAVLISSTLAEQKKVKAGDTIWIGWEGVTQQPFRVFGVIDYFPTFNPLPTRGIDSSVGVGKTPLLIVGHLSRIQLQLAMEPYQIWLKLKPDASTAELYKGIEENKLAISKITNTKEDLILAKNDPFLLALNGILTLGFVISLLVSFIGFLLYWVLSLRGRTLQNGILRAIGLSVGNLIAMLAVEQVLTSGVAVLLGIIVGNLASLLYVPNFQIVFNPSSLVPPFLVQIDPSDMVRIYWMVGIMLTIGIGILAYMLSRLRIHQALKLGED
ncbi:ABC transporter permease [Paenibacillus paeoniae]|uniref:ABC transporter permease n=1 Tax=Paenibacillus paeoniae TaxID=2292705 RepID=A0A371PFF7_9BACL|nr:ABC transporter permease [Paenibacillus paeoniae]REK74693.1 ABC transporter permease [Paenibacillus paeoniae]